VRILVQGRDNDGEVETYGSLESEDLAIRVTAEPGAKAAEVMQFVAKHALFQGPGKPLLQPGSVEWLDKLPRGLSGSWLWCVRAKRHLHGRA
jgi:hypothetical protein